MDLSSLAGGVAVLTGSASGLGLAMAKECMKHGMHVAISDVRSEPLEKAVDTLRQSSGSLHVEGFLCDVTSATSVDALLASVGHAFPGSPIQFVAANAGVVFTASTVLTGSLEEWDMTYRVNVMGVVHTLRTFMPVLLSQPQNALVEITASAAAISFGSLGPYGSSKSAVLGIAEALWKELNVAEGSPLDKIALVALCPALVKTGLLESAGQKARGPDRTVAQGDVASLNAAAFMDTVWEAGMSPEFCAEEVFRHAADGKFYCVLDNSVERDGFSTDLDGVVADRFCAIRTRDLKANLKPRFMSSPPPSKL